MPDGSPVIALKGQRAGSPDVKFRTMAGTVLEVTYFWKSDEGSLHGTTEQLKEVSAPQKYPHK
jgi:hypothetical protein